MEELYYESATSLARMIRDKQVSCSEVVEAHLRRIEEVNPKLNAVVQVVADRATAEARRADEALASGRSKGPLHGVPLTIKDSLDTQGIVSTCGTQGRASLVPDRDATVVARLRSAGAIMLGKTNTPEFTMAGETDNLIYGRTNNPYDPARSTGGSSGGAGAIVASGGSALDLGSDTAGSIRLPAHFCGITGLKPTFGRVPRTGHIPPFGLGALDSLTQVGPMARFVEDLWLILPIIAGEDRTDPSVVPMPLRDPNKVDVRRLRVAVYTDNGVLPSTKETVRAVQAAASALGEAGATVHENRPDAVPKAPELFHRLSGADGGAWLRRLTDAAGTTRLFHWLDETLAEGKVIPADEYTALLEELDAFRAEMHAFMRRYDLILCPVSPFPAFPHGSWPELDTVTSTVASNITGWPGVSVRAGTSPEGLPIGVQVVARRWREDHALAAARCVEEALGGWQRPPL